MKKIFVILDNIRSVHNVGSIFRTSEGAGVSKIYLCGVTPSPIDRFGRIRKDFAKVSLGTEKIISWESVSNTEDVIEKLKAEGVCVVAVEQDKCAKNIKEMLFSKPTAFVFGEETKGISKEILNKCDDIVEIPMYGTKESLNVSVVAGIVLFGVY
jgi:tRNA G18 (ribose-2'-O)-methylase SpoU